MYIPICEKTLHITISFAVDAFSPIHINEINIPAPLLFMVVKHMGQMVYNSGHENQGSRWQRPHVEYVANLALKAAKLPAVGSV